MSIDCFLFCWGNQTTCYYQWNSLVLKHNVLWFLLHRHGSRLRIENALLNDTGTYRCFAVNSVGQSRPKRTRVIVSTVTSNCPDNSAPCVDQRYCLHDGLCCHIDMLDVKLCQYVIYSFWLFIHSFIIMQACWKMIIIVHLKSVFLDNCDVTVSLGCSSMLDSANLPS